MYLIMDLMGRQVRKLNSMNAGIVMFSGQFFDALATPLVGILSDMTDVRTFHSTMVMIIDVLKSMTSLYTCTHLRVLVHVAEECSGTR